jgi:hypothetical protein
VRLLFLSALFDPLPKAKEASKDSTGPFANSNYPFTFTLNILAVAALPDRYILRCM